MDLILNIETATDVCSVALAKNGTLLALRQSNHGRANAQNVAKYIEELFSETSTSPQDLMAVAVSKGPGSYTGLRIGTSIAKGIAYALEIPLIAVNTLESLCRVAQTENHNLQGRFCPMIDARRMEIYTQVFDNKLNALTNVEAKIIEHGSFNEFDDSTPFIIFGNGAAKCIETLAMQNINYIEVTPSATGMITSSQAAYTAKKFEDVAYFEPFYLKEFYFASKAQAIK